MAGPSETEAALTALQAALTTKSQEPGAAFPAPPRNETLPTQFAVFGDVRMFFNLLDGDGEIGDQVLSEPDGVVKVYELIHRAALELAVEHEDQATRDAAFDAAMVAIDDALIADRTLGGSVDRAEIERVQRSGLAFDGSPGVQAAEITIALSFTSARPF